MTINRPIETEAAVRTALELNEDLFLDSARALEALTERVRAGVVPDLTDTKKTISALREQETLMMKERERVLQQRIIAEGGGGPGVIDFQAVRAEVGRRLDLLRTAKRAG